jgi:hypothetical protein
MSWGLCRVCVGAVQLESVSKLLAIRCVQYGAPRPNRGVGVKRPPRGGWVNPVLEMIQWIISGVNARSAVHGRCQIRDLAFSAPLAALNGV